MLVIGELENILMELTEAIKKNEREVKEKMAEIIDQNAANKPRNDVFDLIKEGGLEKGDENIMKNVMDDGTNDVKKEIVAEKESKVMKVKVNEVNDLKVDKIVFDEIKEEFESFKTFDKKLVEVAVEKGIELKAMKVEHELKDLKDNENMFNKIKEELKNSNETVDAKDENIVEEESKVKKEYVEVNDLKMDKIVFYELKEDHDRGVQIDPGGMMPSVLEVQELYEKETKQLLILSHLQPGVNISSSSQCYSQAKEKYEYTTDMLVKVARVENKAHAGFELLKQDLMTLGIKHEIEVTTLFGHLQSGVNVSSSLLWSSQTQAKERYEDTTAMLTGVENTALARRW